MECLLASSKAMEAAVDKQLTFNNAKVSFNLVKEGTLNFSAFKTNRMGKDHLQKLNGKLSPELDKIFPTLFLV
jgi:hypothetical protein